MKEKKTSEFVGSIFGNIIGIIINNTVLLWRHLTGGIILDTWIDTLWASNLSMVVQIIGNLILSFYRPSQLYSFIQLIFSGVNLLSIIVFYIVFPIDFSHAVGDWLNNVARIAMMVAMAVTLISGLVHLVRTVIGTEYESKSRQKQNDHGCD